MSMSRISVLEGARRIARARVTHLRSMPFSFGPLDSVWELSPELRRDTPWRVHQRYLLSSSKKVIPSLQLAAQQYLDVAVAIFHLEGIVHLFVRMVVRDIFYLQ